MWGAFAAAGGTCRVCAERRGEAGCFAFGGGRVPGALFFFHRFSISVRHYLSLAYPAGFASQQDLPRAERTVIVPPFGVRLQYDCVIRGIE